MTVEAEIELVVARRHWDPHHVLGAHPLDDGVVVRAFRPDAREVLVRLEGGESVMLEQRHPAGLFEVLLHGARLPLRYELVASYADGNVYTFRDAYAFAPTLGDIDLHLVGEGRHEEVYERLGAHVREIDGALGTVVRRVGAGRAGGERRRRLQFLGRPPARDARAWCDLGSGRFSSRTSWRAPRTSSRSSPRAVTF